MAQISSGAPSKAVLIQAARILIESEEDEDFPIAESMLRNILIERATADAGARLDSACLDYLHPREISLPAE